MTITLTLDERKARLTHQIETCLSLVNNPLDYTVCQIGTADKGICKSVNLLLVNGDQYIKLIPTDEYFNYLVNKVTGEKIEF